VFIAAPDKKKTSLYDSQKRFPALLSMEILPEPQVEIDYYRGMYTQRSQYFRPFQVKANADEEQSTATSNRRKTKSLNSPNLVVNALFRMLVGNHGGEPILEPENSEGNLSCVRFVELKSFHQKKL
jgi:hypothetical protein